MEPLSGSRSCESSYAGSASGVIDGLLQRNGGFAVLDGGMATELERRGQNIDDPLWSARCLIDNPDLIRDIHLDYLRSGSDIIISSSYQATFQGFEKRGYGREQARELFLTSVRLAGEAREQFMKETHHTDDGGTDVNSNSGSNRTPSSGSNDYGFNAGTIGKKRNSKEGESKKFCTQYGREEAAEQEEKERPRMPLVAASVGSYGAFLADGSEYSGDYGDVTIEDLMDFHRDRIILLATSGVDLLALETIPSRMEAEALIRVLEEEDVPIPSWITYVSMDGVHSARGDPFEECVAVADRCNKIVAVGSNCVSPRFVQSLVTIAKQVTSKPIVVYPNSGEAWDDDKKEWVASTGVSEEDFASYVPEWRDNGASLFGGCCRTTPSTIRAIAAALRA
ncbi:hypothetical protein CBR_g57878 [Chara braunii]|uniref:Hcy-binding domain-containing protein n=1 Tax=Chara braunii TaxID=69332 RepID=A0A388K8B2_CHABU|nr:hypothetical protein CBR_g57878 [Chara braunii]|eukprot:GBG66280.1 hypothetical protein CBR_g57878 [Chara braunii]